ncbi:MAG TPA: protease, partial [Peptostreptococcaceae bacterium]|nr:protease [Peptostreptococcaceae bacterium]
MFRGIAKMLITAILGALIGSAITLYAAPIVMDDEETNVNDNEQRIVVQGDGKSENIYRAVTEKSMPSVVGITTVTIDRSNIFSLPQELQGVGTGVIVNSDGYILTNSHVVSDGEAVDVGV